MSQAGTVRVLVEGLAIGESPRWYDGRLWLSHWGAGEVLAVAPDGRCTVEAPGRPGLGWATAWLPDGRLLVTGETLLRRERDGSFVEHADIRGVCTRGCSEIVVDGRGNIYVNSIEFDFLGGGEPTGGVIALITPDGTVRRSGVRPPSAQRTARASSKVVRSPVASSSTTSASRACSVVRTAARSSC